MLNQEMHFSSESEDDRPPTLEHFDHPYQHPKTNDARFISAGIDQRISQINFDLLLSRYENIRKIAEGGNGSVHLYKRKKSGKLFAVKIISIDEECANICIKNFKEVLTLQKCRSLGKHYKMILSLTKKTCYMFMKYYQFLPLDPKVGYPEQVAIYISQELKNIVGQILQGLKFMHSKNFYHRDIKPENILYDRPTRQIVIVDFGVSRRVKGGQANTITGTLAYRAPEMGLQFRYNNKVDIYSLGITIYEMVTGNVPIKSYGSMNDLNVETCIKLKKNDGLDFSHWQWKNYSQRLRGLINLMVKYLPAERYDVLDCLNHPWFINDNDIQGSKKNLGKKGVQEREAKSQMHKSLLQELKDNSLPKTPNKEGNETSSSSNHILIKGIEMICSEDEEEYAYQKQEEQEIIILN